VYILIEIQVTVVKATKGRLNLINREIFFFNLYSLIKLSLS
jgi:hypothetical protein